MIKATKPPSTPQPKMFSQPGDTAPQMAQQRAPGGKGFLIDHNQFTDARPPRARGMSKSAGYPSFAKKST